MVARRRTLLLADDSLTIQKVVSLTFSDEGVEVVTASDGAQALRRLEEGPPPDIILADTYMPGPDGYQICERVKRDPSLRHIPVVLLVGTFEPFNEAEARRVGADMVLTKPFQSIKGLVSKVGSLFGGGRQEEEQEATRPLPSAETGARREQSRDFGGARPWDEPRVTETHEGASGVEPAVAASAAEVPFADLELDDQMIESRAVESPDAWASHGERPADWHEEMSVGSWDAHAQPADFEPAPAAQDETHHEDDFAYAGVQHHDESRNSDPPSWEQISPPFEAESQSYSPPDVAEPANSSEPIYTSASSHAGSYEFDDTARPAPQGFGETARAAAQGFGEASPSASRGFEDSSYADARPSAPAVGVASATEDALLDLDDVAFTGVTSSAPAPPAATGFAPADDDFILDLDDGAPRPQSAAHAWADFVPPEATPAPPAPVAPEAEARADAAGSLAEAAHGREAHAPESSGRVGEQTFYFDDAQDETPTVIAPAPRIVWDEQQEQYSA
ncbi:MAG TPA: response regulator, partial [Pyrinomonadaceae bacterium]|nr:response regulator [Pyrinomonadaceae bacterium]